MAPRKKMKTCRKDAVLAPCVRTAVQEAVVLVDDEMGHGQGFDPATFLGQVEHIYSFSAFPTATSRNWSAPL